MNGWIAAELLWSGIARLLLNPLLYIFILVLFLHYFKQMNIQRQLFSVRLTHPVRQTWRAIWMGVIAGIFVSLVAGVAGIAVRPADVWLVWLFAILLSLFRIRFLCMAFGAGLLALFHEAAVWWPEGTEISVIGPLWQELRDAEPLPLLALTAILHLAEAWLVFANRGKDASPLFVEGKRGRIIGAYHLHTLWLTPLCLFVPTEETNGLSLSLFYGWPLFGGEGSSGMFGFLLFPALIGYSDFTQTKLPWQKTREAARKLMWYALGLGVLVVAARWLPFLTPVVALFALIGHEGLYLRSRYLEQKTSPYYIQHERGVKVMAVVPGTPAEEMGILPGEIVVKVNGIPVQVKEDLYRALQVNPAYCKLEMLSHNGEIRFAGTPLFAGNHHQLGIIVVPEADSQFYVERSNLSLLQLLGKGLKRLRLGS